jgi:DNA-binding transcriptional LysR family regulator
MLSTHMDFDRLRAFVWTLDEGGISAAARRLHRTQPAVTRMLQTLEEQIGAQLIDRKARPMRATAAGMKVLEQARTILNLAERLTDGRAHPAAAAQTLRLGVSRSLLWQLRDPRFVTPRPPLSATDFFVRSGWSPRLYRRFVRGELDSAVLLMPSPWAPDVPYAGSVVRGEQLVLIGPRGPNDGAKRSLGGDELDATPWILNPDGCGFRAALARALAGSGRRLHVRFEVDAAPQEHLAMVAAGIGFSIVPASALALSPRHAAQVQQLSVRGFDGALNVWLIWSEQCRPLAGTAEALAAIFAVAETASPLRLAPAAAPIPARRSRRRHA